MPVILIFIPFLLLLALLALLKWCNSQTITHAPTHEKLAALTFDDGPNPGETEDLLKLLENKGVKATFFLLGKHVSAYPEFAAQIAAQGHEIGNHSYSHRFMLGLRMAPMLAELRQTNEIIAAATGQTPRLFRPPYLVQGPGLRRAVSRLGMQSVGTAIRWQTFRYQDWTLQKQPEKIAGIYVGMAQPGHIFLLHDGHAGAKTPASQNYRGGTVLAVGMIIEALQTQGYRFVTVSEMLNR